MDALLFVVAVVCGAVATVWLCCLAALYLAPRLVARWFRGVVAVAGGDRRQAGAARPIARELRAIRRPFAESFALATVTWTGYAVAAATLAAGRTAAFAGALAVALLARWARRPLRGRVFAAARSARPDVAPPIGRSGEHRPGGHGRPGGHRSVGALPPADEDPR
ncbi:MAG: hypothetical protein LC640_01975 [Frankia sp.]|nr:hypothetical protein [Frankia sp.]